MALTIALLGIKGGVGRSSRAAIAYRNLWNEIKTRTHGQRIADSSPS